MRVKVWLGVMEVQEWVSGQGLGTRSWGPPPHFLCLPRNAALGAVKGAFSMAKRGETKVSLFDQHLVILISHIYQISIYPYISIYIQISTPSGAIEILLNCNSPISVIVVQPKPTFSELEENLLRQNYINTFKDTASVEKWYISLCIGAKRREKISQVSSFPIITQLLQELFERKNISNIKPGRFLIARI